jgi:Glycosyltransferase family 87
MMKSQLETNKTRRLAADGVLRVMPYIIGSLLIVFGLAALMRMIVLKDGWPQGTDLTDFLDAADAIAQGKSPYDIDYERVLWGYGYPPLFAELIAALTFLLGHGKLWILWSVFCLGCLIGSIVLMLRGFGPKTDYRWVFLIVGVAMASRMVRGDAYDGAINSLLLLLLLIGLKKFLSGKALAGSVTWAVMIVFKPFMGILALYLLRRRCWKCAILTVAIAGALFAASFLPFIPDHLIETFAGWVHASHARTSLPFVAKPGNQSFYGLFMRLFTPSQFSEPWIVAPIVISVLMLPIIGVALATFLFAVPNQSIVTPVSRPDDGPRALLEVGLVMALSLSCGPLLEGDYIFLFLPGLVGTVMLARMRSGQSARILWLSAIAWCVGLLALVPPVTFRFLEPYLWSLPLSGFTILGTARVCVSLFIASILAAVVLWHDRRDEKLLSA